MPISAINPATPDANSNAGLGDDQIRALKQDIFDCFPGVDGLVESGAGNGAATASELTDLFDRATTLEGKVSQSLVIGEIKMWYGTYANIPAGWKNCDGTGGTPDMRGRFPRGADNASGAPLSSGLAVGGAYGAGLTNATNLTATVDAHQLTIAELPSGLPGALSVQHDTGGDGIQHGNTTSAAGGEQAGTTRAIISGSGFNGDGHTHGLSGSLNHSHTIAAQTPPWAAVYFIMFVGP